MKKQVHELLSPASSKCLRAFCKLMKIHEIDENKQQFDIPGTKKKSEVTLINKYSDLMHNDIIIITTINYHLIKYLIMLINANSGQLVVNKCNTLSFTVGNHPLCFSKYIPINILFKHHLHKCTVPAYFWRGTV